ncbi:hypothetical protein ACFQZR_16130 [Paenibacillus sp. GCM10027629]|uniref:hypothetical protein n=1 Tax=Paenibacillus sp. GCM10027629 TaxID=3273414 RepID=UPI0036364FEB
MKKERMWGVIVLSSMMVLSACGRSESTTIKTDQGTMTVTGDQNGDSVSITGKTSDGKEIKSEYSTTEMPKDFPQDAPIPKGFQLKGSARSEQNGDISVMVTCSGEAKVDTVVQQITDYLNAGGFKDINSFTVDASATLGGKKDGTDFSAIIARDESTGTVDLIITYVLKSTP